MKENSENVKEWKNKLHEVSSTEKAKILSSFFKTGKGEYGEGDKFIGIPVPKIREVTKKYFHRPLNEIEEMLSSPIHEFRLSALLALVEKYRKASVFEKCEIVDFYLSHLSYINNWDLVDLSAPKILGEYTLNENRDILYELSNSDVMWEKRIALVSTITHIRKGYFDVAIDLSEAYLSHSHDLIHKATGWMLREIGKKDESVMINFINIHYNNMPRTTLRYAIERLPEPQRKEILNFSKVQAKS